MITATDLFCGVGWGAACRDLGIIERGIDIEPTVGTVRSAMGWATTTADLLNLDPTDFAGAEGLIASPPCQSWSLAGKRAGLDDPRGQLVWQPLVWARAIRPRWIACEQVPQAKQAFAIIAHELRSLGYHAVVTVLSAEQYGVAQTRRRVFLLAHRDRAVVSPAPTHRAYRFGRPRHELTLDGLAPWVSMADALGIPPSGESAYRPGRSFGKSRRTNEPSFTIPAHVGKDPGRYLLTNQNTQLAGGEVGRYRRSVDSPAPTLTTRGNLFSLAASNQGHAAVRSGDEPAPTLTTRSGQNGRFWPADRPATTICADPRGHHEGSQNAGAVGVEQAGDARPVRLTIEQGGALMGFPSDLTAVIDRAKISQAAAWALIGNAVCPPVARAVLEVLVA